MNYIEIERSALDGGIDKETALSVLNCSEEEFNEILKITKNVTEKFYSKRIDLCAIINAKSGLCSQDCLFCSQSSVSKAEIQKYPLIDHKMIYKSALEAEKCGAKRFGIVTAGKSPTQRELEEICRAIELIKKNLSIEPDASLGILDENRADMLKDAGLKHYNHNLETSRSYFKKICTTQSYEDRVNTVRLIKERGIKACSGGIFGIGENDQDRVELAFTLKELSVDSIPINFLVPIEGTPLARAKRLSKQKALRIIAMFRLVIPDAVLRLCGGKELIFGEDFSMAILAGANATMVGDYLTTKGTGADLIKDRLKSWGYDV